MPQDHQQQDLQPWNRFTYFLRAGKCHKTISNRTCNHETGSLTFWEQANATRPSATEPATMKQVHIHTESKQMPQNHQQQDLQPWNRFTYFLRAGKCHKTISKRTCSYETGSLTCWEQANATRPSARWHAAMKQVHLLSEIRQIPQDHQQEDMQLWNMFTYSLRAGTHTMISQRISSYISHYNLHPSIRKMQLTQSKSYNYYSRPPTSYRQNTYISVSVHNWWCAWHISTHQLSESEIEKLVDIELPQKTTHTF